MNLFNFRHSNRCVLVSHCGFNLNFLNDQTHWASSHVLVCYLSVLFGEVTVQFFFAHFLTGEFIFILLHFESSLYILNTSLIEAIWRASIFSQSVGCIFILLTVPFKEQKFLILMKSNSSFFFSFIEHAFCSCLGTLSQTKGHKCFLLCFLIQVL